MKIGTDIASIKRFKDKNKVAKRILSDEELKLYDATERKDEFLAGRFAAKEAFIKAMVDEEPIPYKKIEVRLEKNGRPYIFYDGKSYAVSISHDGEYAIAISVI